MNSDRTVVGNFSYNCVHLTTSVGSGIGYVQAGPTNAGGCPEGYYPPGYSVTIMATPSGGYMFSGWKGADNNGANPGKVTHVRRQVRDSALCRGQHASTSTPTPTHPTVHRHAARTRPLRDVHIDTDEHASAGRARRTRQRPRSRPTNTPTSTPTNTPLPPDVPTPTPTDTPTSTPTARRCLRAYRRPTPTSTLSAGRADSQRRRARLDRASRRRRQRTVVTDVQTDTDAAAQPSATRDAPARRTATSTATGRRTR